MYTGVHEYVHEYSCTPGYIHVHVLTCGIISVGDRRRSIVQLETNRP